MKQSELERCSIQNWYPTFKPHTIKTLFVPLPAAFIDYLLGSSSAADSPPPPFLLPRPASGADPLPRAPLDPTSSLSLLSSDSDSDSDSPSLSPPSFPDLESAVTRAIADLGGAAFPKLNWSSPKDAAWITLDGTLCCRSFPDLALLLRSSDSISHNLSYALPSCSDHDPTSPPTFYLALRKWYPSFHPEMEFRCFVRRQRLIAISQRDVTSFYPQILDRPDLHHGESENNHLDLATSPSATNTASCSTPTDSSNNDKATDSRKLGDAHVNGTTVSGKESKTLPSTSTIEIADNASGNDQLLQHTDIKGFDPIHQHRPFCPWVATENGDNMTGWKLTLSSLISQEKHHSVPSDPEAPSIILDEDDDPVVSVRKLFMSPPAKRLKGSR